MQVADGGKPRKAKGKQGSNFSTEDTGVAKHRRDFEKFHDENGVRTVMGSIGPVDNGTCLCIWKWPAHDAA